MDYQKAAGFLNSLINYERFSNYNYKKAYNLQRIERLLSCLGNPHKKYPSVIISGTTGKGSCVYTLSSILSASCVKTGTFISPHLFSIRERIRTGRREISCEEFSYAVSQVKRVISKRGIRGITFFEALSATAFLYFSYKNIEIAVLEVGLGGRLDATNVSTPIITGITPIGYDHTHLLGSTLSEIAREKCGIIRSRSTVISGPQRPEALNVIKTAAYSRKAKLLLYGRDMASRNIRVSLSGTRFDLKTAKARYKKLHTPLIGRHQAVNAAVAVSLAENIGKTLNFKIKRAQIREGLARTAACGRFQVLAKNPYIILDGAHNQESIKALTAAFIEIFGKIRPCIILGLSADKDARAIVKQLSAISANMIFTRSGSSRSLEPDSLAQRAQALSAASYACYDIEDALGLARSLTDKSGVILITGSFFLAKEALEAVRKSTRHKGQGKLYGK